MSAQYERRTREIVVRKWKFFNKYFITYKKPRKKKYLRQIRMGFTVALASAIRNGANKNLLSGRRNREKTALAHSTCCFAAHSRSRLNTNL